MFRSRNLLDIAIHACKAYKVSMDELFGRDRTRRVIRARKYVACQLRANGLSQEDVARLLGRSRNAAANLLGRPRSPRPKRREFL